MAERLEGYYWVKLRHHPLGRAEWEVMHWFGEEWWAAGVDCRFRDSDLAQIGEHLAPPRET